MNIILINCLIAYLLGSISSAVLLCRAYGLPDPRSTGSNNPGATNAMRIGGKKLAVLVLVADALKGVIAVAIARWWGLEGFALAVVGALAVIGHIFPCWFRFRGGKGVATTIGAVLTLSLWLGLAFVLVWLAVYLLTRISSLSALIAVASLTPLSFWLLRPTWPVMLVLSILLIWTHRENIQRLLKGSEAQIR